MNNERKPINVAIAIITVGLIAVIGATGYQLYDRKSSGDVKANNDIAVNELEDGFYDDQSTDDGSTDEDISETIDDQSTEQAITEKPIPIVENNVTPAVVPAPTPTPTVPPVEDPAPITPEPDNDEPVTPKGFILADFESGSLENWVGMGIIGEPGFKSHNSLKLSTPEFDSSAAKRIFDTPILKGYSKIELDLKALNYSVLPGDASALAFEQDGQWKWVSLSSYTDEEKSDWQHITIPLSDFIGLDTTKDISNLTFRFWNLTVSDYYIDNIVLTGKIESNLNQPTDLNYTALSDKQIDLSWTGDSAQYNVYKDGLLIGLVTEPKYSAVDLDPNTEYKFYVTATDGTDESAPSESLSISTLSPILEDFIISNFDDESSDGWSGDSILVPGLNSGFALQLTNLENQASEIMRDFNSAIAKGYTNLEFDINLNGNYFGDEDATVAFDQDGYMPVFIMRYVDGTSSDWQHVKIPLSDFAGLNTDEAIATISFRFWHSSPVNIELDNIALN